VLAERLLRTELTQRDESIPNQVGKPTQRPTIRRIFQVFQGIDVLLIKHPLGIQRQVLNPKPIHLRVLDLLGPEVKKILHPRWMTAERRLNAPFRGSMQKKTTTFCDVYLTIIIFFISRRDGPDEV